MNKNEINALVAKLAEAKEVISAAGETAFDDLGWRKKTQIFKLFSAGFESEHDGDSDGASESFYFGEFNITFSSACRDWDDFERDMRDMYFTYSDDQYDATLDEIDKAIAYLRSLSPEVVGVLNTSIATVPGDYKLEVITLEQAREIAQSCVLDSAIGHEATAQIMTAVLQTDVPFKRQIFQQQAGQRCIVFKIRGRVPEGTVLTLADINKMGYDLMLLTRTA